MASGQETQERQKTIFFIFMFKTFFFQNLSNPKNPFLQFGDAIACHSQCRAEINLSQKSVKCITFSILSHIYHHSTGSWGMVNHWKTHFGVYCTKLFLSLFGFLFLFVCFLSWEHAWKRRKKSQKNVPRKVSWEISIMHKWSRNSWYILLEDFL